MILTACGKSARPLKSATISGDEGQQTENIAERKGDDDWRDHLEMQTSSLYKSRRIDRSLTDVRSIVVIKVDSHVMGAVGNSLSLAKQQEQPVCPGRSETIVISSSVRPAAVQYLSMADPMDRLRETVASLLCWFDQARVKSVVLCDNSGVEFDFEPLARIAATRGVEFEPIVFADNAIAVQRGKGAGEGQILDHALSNSRVLQASSSFWKCTGKLVVGNFDEVAAAHQGDEAVFKVPGWTHRCRFEPARLGVLRAGVRWGRSRLSCLARRVRYGFDPDRNVNTQFWKTSIDFFNRVLRHAYLSVNDRHRYFIEHAYGCALRGTVVAPFKIEPQIRGRGGSVSVTYGGGLPPEPIALAEQVMEASRIVGDSDRVR